jgi:hypothetical protein
VKPQFNWDGNNVGPKILRMPQALGVVALGLFQLGAPIWVSNALVGLAGFLGSGLGQLLLAAGAYGLNLLLQKKPAAPQPSDVQTNIRQEISARRRIYGRALVGSIIVFGFRRGEKSYILHYICEGPIEDFVSFRLDKKPITLDENGFVEEEQYSVGDRSRVQILTTKGLMTDEPFAELLAAFPELNTPLTPFRHRGCVMALQIVEQVPQEKLADVYPNNMPALQMVIDGASRVWDPRTSAYGFSENAGCCLLTEVMDVYGLLPSSTDDVDFASFATFADHCDEAVALKAGGTEKRYRVGGVIMLDGENEARILALSTVCNADVYFNPQGKIAVRRKMRSTPGIALRAKNGDHLEVQMEGGRGLQKQFNVAKISYVEPALNYKANEVRWAHYDLIAEDGREYPQPVSATLCPSPTQAMRIGKLAVYEGNPDFIGSLTAGPQALDLLEDYVFTLDLSPEDAFERVACASEGVGYDGNTMKVSAPYVVYRTGATAWNAAIDEQEQIVVPPELPSNVDDVLLDVTVTVELLNNSAPVLSFAWEAASGVLPDSYAQQVEVSPAGTNQWSAAAVTQDTNTAKFAPVADGGAYDWRIRNIAAGKTQDWQNSTTPVTVHIDTTAPVALGSVSATGGLVQLGTVALTIVTKNDPHLRRVAIYRVPAGAALNKTTHLLARADVPIATTVAFLHGDGTRAEMITDPGFSNPSAWTAGTGWSVTAGAANGVAGVNSVIDQAVTLTPGATYRYAAQGSDVTAGVLQARLSGGSNVSGSSFTNGWRFGEVVAVAGNNRAGINKTSTFAGKVDNFHLFAKSGEEATAGQWDIYVIPENISGVEGPQRLLPNLITV